MTRSHRPLTGRSLVPPGRVPDGCFRPTSLWLVRLVPVSAMILILWAAYQADTLPWSVSMSARS